MTSCVSNARSYNARKVEMVEEIRSMWCDTLEELLQCPVCLEVGEGSKHQCLNGHHICDECKLQLETCPMCKSYFIATRNLAVEQISAKLKEIKLSLLNPHHPVNRRILKNKVCVATQTEDIHKSLNSIGCQTDLMPTRTNSVAKNAQQLANEQKPFILSPKIGKGLYPCRIGSCTMTLPHGRMIGHLRYYHKHEFYEFNERCTVFKRNWNLEYNPCQDYDFGFLIKGMGLFFLNVSILERGDLMATVQIVNSNDASKMFMYTLETGKGLNRMCHTSQVQSCQINERFVRDCLYVNDSKMHRIIDNRKVFYCNLTIKRKNDHSDHPRSSTK